MFLSVTCPVYVHLLTFATHLASVAHPVPAPIPVPYPATLFSSFAYSPFPHLTYHHLCHYIRVHLVLDYELSPTLIFA